MENFFGAGGRASGDFKTILEQISSDDIMFQYEGVQQLRNSLAMAQDSSLSRFPHEAFCQKLVALIKQPALMEISNEIKNMAIQSVVTIMDIYPSHVGYLVSLGIGAAIKETIEQQMGYIDLVEQCIKCSEKISQENPRDILKHGTLTMALNMIDFFDKSTQTKIIQLLLNVSSASESEVDFQQNFLPIMPNICEMLKQAVRSGSDSVRIEKLSTVLIKLCCSFSNFIDPLENFNQIGNLFEQLSNADVHETIFDVLRLYSKSIQTQKYDKNDLTNQIINTEAITTQQTFTEISISNLLKILMMSCQYSYLIVIQLISAGIFDIIEPILPLAENNVNQENSIISDVLSLCQQIFPAIEDDSNQIQDSTQKEILEIGSIRKKFIDVNNVKCQKYYKERNSIEIQKKEFFQSQDNQLHNQISKSLLPRIFAAYNQQINNEFRTKCLTLIQRMLQVIPQQLLKESFDPASFTKFIHMILRTHQPQQVLCILRTVLQQLQSEYGQQLAIYFIRHGINETILEYISQESINKFNEFEPQQKQNLPREFTKLEFLSQEKEQILHLTAAERDRITNRLKDMQSLLEQIPQGVKHEELMRLTQKYEATLKALDLRKAEIQAVPDLKSENNATTAKVQQKIQFGTLIAEVAQEIRQKYIDNEQYWSAVKLQHPQEVGFFQTLQQLASQIQQDACSVFFDQERSQKNMSQLSQILTLQQSLTSFEFENSGLLNSIQMLLTMSPNEAINSLNKYEETKQNIQPGEIKQITKQEAETYILRLKHFVDAMCNKINNKLPYTQLLQLCHDQITLAEPLIFKELSLNQGGHLEALNELSRSVIINLVFDADGKHCEASSNNQLPDEPNLFKAKSVPFNSLQAPDIAQKSLLYLKRSHLYDLLKEVPLSIQRCDNITLLEEFLLKRVKTKTDVEALINQTQRHFSYAKKAQKQPGEEDEEIQDLENLEDQEFDESNIDADLEPLYSKSMDRITDLMEESLDHSMFVQLQENIITDIVQFVKEWEEQENKKTPEVLWKYLQVNTASIIKQTVLQEQEEGSDQEMAEGFDMELVLQEIHIKTASFQQLIEKIQERCKEQTSKSNLKTSSAISKKKADESVDEIMENSNLSESNQQNSHNEGSQPEKSEDVEMTEELHDSNQQSEKKSEQSEDDAEMSDLPSSNQSIKKIPQAKKPFSYQHENFDSTLSIEELLKENNNEDIEILFYYNKRLLDKNTSFYEICKEPILPLENKDSSQKNKTETPSTLKQMMEHLTGQMGYANECRTIYFKIRDRKTNKQIQRKDSLLEYTQIRQRTKSQVVEEINALSINHIVQQLINDFSINDINIQKIGEEVTTARLSQQKCLEHTLKLTKVLNFIYNNNSVFTSKGISFLMLTSSQIGQQNTDSQDYQIKNLANEIVQNPFYHAKLDSNLQKAIQDPYKLVSGGINDTLKSIFNSCSFLFSFETKLLFLRLVSFISVDMNRSIFFLRQHMKKNGIKKQTSQKEESRQRQQEKQKVKVDRNISIVQQSLKFIQDVRKRAMLEIVFKDEEGVGHGPTLEFYSALSNELRQDKTLWRKNTVNGNLYPKSIQITSSNQAQVKQICEKFQLIGAFVARSIFDNRLIDLPISPLMWDLIFLKRKNLFDLQKLDTDLFTLFSELQLMANRKQEINQMNISPESKERLVSQIRSSKNASIEDYDLSFYDPSDETVELVKDGKNISVTLQNLQQYIDLVLDSTFNESIRLQITAFKKGFTSIMPVESLKIFQTKDEIETLVCGESSFHSNEAEWSNATRLQELINTAHGYHQQSKSFLEFLKYITELAPKDRPAFIQFLTGSPRLPIGGFGALEPRLTVVLKKPSNSKEKADQILPSVMTCQNYVKMPEYSNYNVLKQRFDLAVKEGANNFTLS